MSPHKDQPVSHAGVSLNEATTAMVLLHGRGATAHGILDLARVLTLEGMAYFAPQAASNTWYPYRFIAPIEQNEPYLSSALEKIDQVIAHIKTAGIPEDKIVLGGFSQGACLAAEYVARNPSRYGGLLVFSGGLIGPIGQLPQYSGSLDGTPVFLGCSDIDAHIPLERVNESADILEQLGGAVTKRIYSGMGHTINTEEIREAQSLLLAI